MFELEEYVDLAFVTCAKLDANNIQLSPERIMQELLPNLADGEAGYWQKDNLGYCLTILAKSHLITSERSVRFTPNLGLALPTVKGRLTFAGKVFSKFPKILRILCFFIYLKFKKVMPIITGLASLGAAKNALGGIAILGTGYEWLAAMIAGYLIFLITRHYLP